MNLVCERLVPEISIKMSVLLVAGSSLRRMSKIRLKKCFSESSQLMFQTSNAKARVADFIVDQGVGVGDTAGRMVAD